MAEVKKILIIRLSSFGDIILTFPLVDIIRNKFPQAQLSFLVKENYAELVKLNPKVNEIISFTGSNENALKEQMRTAEYDVIIDLQNNPRSRILTTGLSNVHRFRKNNFKKFLLVKFKINKLQYTEPVYKRYIRAAEEPLGFSEDEMEFRSSVLTYEKIDHGSDYVAIAPSSRHFTKTYPKEKFVEYIKTHPEQKYILVGDNSDTDMSICSYIKENTDNTKNLCGELSYSELASVIAGSNYVVCNDSGILHLAEALGKRVVSIFGSTVREFGFFPQLDGSIVYEVEGLKCRPCSHIGLPECPLGHFKCMMEIKLD